MGIASSYIKAVNSIAKNGSRPDFVFNVHMYGIRKTFELIEAECGGRNWGGFSYLREGITEEGKIATDCNPDPQGMEAIRRGLEESELYEKVLSGDAGELAELNAETLKYFWTILGGVVAKYASNIDGRDNYFSWPGFDDPSLSWTDG